MGASTDGSDSASFRHGSTTVTRPSGMVFDSRGTVAPLGAVPWENRPSLLLSEVEVAAGRLATGRAASRPTTGRPTTGRPTASRPTTGRPTASRPTTGR